MWTVNLKPYLKQLYKQCMVRCWVFCIHHCFIIILRMIKKADIQIKVVLIELHPVDTCRSANFSVYSIMHDAKLPMWYMRRDSITKRFKCWEEFYEHSGNKDNIIIPLLIKLGLTHQVVDIVKVLNVRYNWL